MKTFYPFPWFSCRRWKWYFLLDWDLLTMTWIKNDFRALFEHYSNVLARKTSLIWLELVTLIVGSGKMSFLLIFVEHLSNGDCICLRWSRERWRTHLTTRFTLVLPLTCGECQVHVKCWCDLNVICTSAIHDTWTVTSPLLSKANQSVSAGRLLNSRQNSVQFVTPPLLPRVSAERLPSSRHDSI